MSAALREVTDPQRLYELRKCVQETPLTLDPSIPWRLYRAFETSAMYEDNGIFYYHVEITNPAEGYVLRGMLAWPPGQLYLDVQSTLLLVQWRIDATLDAFNAGHHWRYKGL